METPPRSGTPEKIGFAGRPAANNARALAMNPRAARNARLTAAAVARDPELSKTKMLFNFTRGEVNREVAHMFRGIPGLKVVNGAAAQRAEGAGGAGGAPRVIPYNFSRSLQPSRQGTLSGSEVHTAEGSEESEGEFPENNPKGAKRIRKTNTPQKGGTKKRRANRKLKKLKTRKQRK